MPGPPPALPETYTWRIDEISLHYTPTRRLFHVDRPLRAVAMIQPFQGQWHVRVNLQAKAWEERHANAATEAQAEGWVIRWLLRDRARIERDLNLPTEPEPPTSS